MKSLSYILPILLISAVPAFASVDISSPANGQSVSSPFSLSANASECSSQPVTSMAYSIDNGSDVAPVQGTSIDTQVSAPAGTHTVHVKAWGDQGAQCVADTSVTVANVTDDVAADTSVVPSNSIKVGSIQALGGWKGVHDAGTPGGASGSSYTVGSPSHAGRARKFAFSYSNGGGERYSVHFSDDRNSQNFMYDGWVYLTPSADHIANLELDVMQTMANGQTAIFGIQCDSYSGTWDYTENLGSASHHRGHWAHSSAPCHLHSWSKNTWHHVQMSFSRTSSGRITYKSIWLDGHQYGINRTVFGANDLGWGSSIITNFQVDGQGSGGSSTVYLDDLTISRW